LDPAAGFLTTTLASKRTPLEVIHQRGLANTRLAPHDRHPPPAGPDRLDQPVEQRLALVAPVT
jgi:hypothetical protein